MSTELDALKVESAWALVKKASTPAEKYEAGQKAIEEVGQNPFGIPIPRLALDFPWENSNSATVDNILVNLIAADDVESQTGDRQLRKVEDIIGQPVEIHDVRARMSDVEPEPGQTETGGWGFYLSMDLSVNGGPREVVNASPRQAVTRLWQLWCKGMFPVSGRFVYVGQKAKGRNQPVSFDVETKL